MKQRHILLLTLGILISSFLFISCDGIELLDSSTIIQETKKDTRSVSKLDSTFLNIVSVCAFTHNNYIYNIQDRQDYCHIYLDGAEYPTYPNVSIPLKNDEYVDMQYKMPFGKHQVKVIVMVDEGLRYSYRKCTISATSEVTNLGKEFYYNTVDLDYDHTSSTTAGFVAEFNVDYPYTNEHNYALSIDLYFE